MTEITAFTDKNRIPTVSITDLVNRPKTTLYGTLMDIDLFDIVAATNMVV